jgi:hypothetical protein
MASKRPAGPAFPTTTERGDREDAARSNVHFYQSSPLLKLGILPPLQRTPNPGVSGVLTVSAAGIARR